MKMNKACVIKIACSNKHSLVCTNTGALFAWGQNDHNQLGFTYHKVGAEAQSQGGMLGNMTTYDHENMFAMTPRRVENTGKNFFIDVACGDNHSLALNSSREAFVWGSNKQGQLGHDPDMYKMIATPKKLILHEYMNSSNKEVLTTIKAKANYSVLIAESKHIYVSSRNSESPFMPLFGKQQSQQNSRRNHLGSLKKMEQAVFLSESYLLCMD
jgi:alpha-tubulin suppressor-like RCC1 family protein